MMTLFITRLHRSINNNNHFWLYLLLCFAGQKITTTYAQNLEQWSYTNTITRENGNNVYGPSDWLKVKCNDLDTCVSIFPIKNLVLILLLCFVSIPFLIFNFSQKNL